MRIRRAVRCPNCKERLRAHALLVGFKAPAAFYWEPCDKKRCGWVTCVYCRITVDSRTRRSMDAKITVFQG